MISTGRGASFEVLVAAMPSGRGVTLEQEIEVVKPALLYGDSVRIMGPGIASLYHLANQVALPVDEQLEGSYRYIALRYPEEWEKVRLIKQRVDRLRKKGWRTTQGRVKLKQIEARQEQAERELLDLGTQFKQVLRDAGYFEVKAAVEAGILLIDPVLAENAFIESDLSSRLWHAYVEKLGSILLERGAYPLFDEFTAKVIQAGISDGIFQPMKLVDEHGKQIGAASHFMHRLPAFSGASISEILDIRSELREPLVRFRAAMIEMGALIGSMAYGEGFRKQVEELARAKIDPALLEIEERVRDNNYLKQLLTKVVPDTKAMLTGALAVGFTQLAELPALWAVGTGALPAAIQAAWSTEIERRQEAREIRRHEMYFLHRTQKLLG